jgi:hypothetical protein
LLLRVFADGFISWPNDGTPERDEDYAADLPPFGVVLSSAKLFLRCYAAASRITLLVYVGERIYTSRRPASRTKKVNEGGKWRRLLQAKVGEWLMVSLLGKTKRGSVRKRATFCLTAAGQDGQDIQLKDVE